MAQMATIPVYKCRRCGKPVYATHLSTQKDEGAKMLQAFMQNLQKIALCRECQRIYNWLAQQDRTDEFLVNPHIVILNVVDNTELDYYGRNMK